MQHTQPPASQVLAAAEAIDQRACAGSAEPQGHRVDGKVAARQIVGQRCGRHRGQRAGPPIALHPRLSEIEPESISLYHDRTEAPVRYQPRTKRRGERAGEWSSVALHHHIEV